MISYKKTKNSSKPTMTSQEKKGFFKSRTETREWVFNVLKMIVGRMLKRTNAGHA
jgi:hypothetical protein